MSDRAQLERLDPAMRSRLETVIAGLNVAEAADRQHRGFTNILKPEQWHINTERGGVKFINIDCGTSGAFLMERASGELFNIKGYGVPDTNKKQKADIGNIMTVDPAVLQSKRWNSLR